MDSEYKAGTDGGQVPSIRNSHVKVANPRSFRSSDFLLRLVAVVTTLAAAIVMAVAKETETVPFVLIPGVSPIQVPVTAKMRYSSAFVYFVVGNAIACAYSALSLLVMIATQAKRKGLTRGVAILDVLMVSLLFSSIGAATAVSLLGYKGNSHVGWNKVCNVFEKYCHNVMASLIISMIGSMAFVLIVTLSTLNRQ